MSGEYLKTPMAYELPRAVQKVIQDALQRQGKSLPASVEANPSSGIVIVKFEVEGPYTLPNVKCPVAMSEYVRFPTPAGTRGLVVSADAYLGGVSGLGGGVASLTQPANLQSLVFAPLGNSSWSGVDLARVVVYGPEGVEVLGSEGSDYLVQVTDTEVKMTSGGATVKVSGSRIDLDGTLYINGNQYTQHKHSGVQTGPGNTGGVVP